MEGVFKVAEAIDGGIWMLGDQWKLELLESHADGRADGSG